MKVAITTEASKFPGSRPINVKKTGRRLIRLSAGGASVTGHARLIPVSVGYLR